MFTPEGEFLAEGKVQVDNIEKAPEINGYTAATKKPLELTAEGITEEEAVEELALLIAVHISEYLKWNRLNEFFDGEKREVDDSEVSEIQERMRQETKDTVYFVIEREVD
ncbi:hypothetical protein KJ632_00545 [Patescibacteria group bacterium]|nr:hypothetical protein [Patescibacteria group bacterium]